MKHLIFPIATVVSIIMFATGCDKSVDQVVNEQAAQTTKPGHGGFRTGESPGELHNAMLDLIAAAGDPGALSREEAFDMMVEELETEYSLEWPESLTFEDVDAQVTEGYTYTDITDLTAAMLLDEVITSDVKLYIDSIEWFGSTYYTNYYTLATKLSQYQTRVDALDLDTDEEEAMVSSVVSITRFSIDYWWDVAQGSHPFDALTHGSPLTLPITNPNLQYPDRLHWPFWTTADIIGATLGAGAGIGGGPAGIIISAVVTGGLSSLAALLFD
jgi:hypothetical protein